MFSGVCLDLPAGGIAHLRGPNGAGKSSLLAILAGLIGPSAGHGNFDGRPLKSGGFSDLVALAGHQDALKSALTLRENILAWIYILGGNPRMVDSVMDRFGLTSRANIPAERCSAGERRRAALARVVASDRPLWLLDEPTASLDEVARGCLADALQQHAENGGLAVVSLHAALDPQPAVVVDLAALGSSQ